MRRKWRNRLGVSTVIANMLMILITMSLAAILVAWAGTSFGAFSSGSQLFFAQRGQALQERFVIEIVFFNKTNNYVYLFVRNVGLVDIKLSSIYVNGNAITPTCSSPWQCLGKTSASNLDLPVQQVVELPLNYGSAWTSGTVFNIVAASSRGNQVQAMARGP